MALEVEVMDGPNDEGEQYERAGRLSDPLPRRALRLRRRRCTAAQLRMLLKRVHQNLRLQNCVCVCFSHLLYRQLTVRKALTCCVQSDSLASCEESMSTACTLLGIS